MPVTAGIGGMILVVRRETHPVAAEVAGAVVYDTVAGVSAVGGHVDAVLGVRLVTDRERPVLGQVPASRRLLLYLNPQSEGTNCGFPAFRDNVILTTMRKR